MDPLLEPLVGQPRDAEQFDAIAELLGEIDVEPRDVPDAFGVDAGEIDRPAKADARQDGELVGGVDAVDVEARIGLGITELLRLGQHLGEFAPALAHRRQDVVRGAVEDAVDALQPVAGKPLAQCLDDRDPARDRSFERQRQAQLLGPRRKPAAVMRHQRLVGGHDMLPVGEGGVDDARGNALRTADQLDDDIDVGIGRHRRRILVPARRRQFDTPVAAPVTRRHRGNDEPAPTALGQQLGLILKQSEGAGADGAEPCDGNL